jgi:hypothetical protein
MKLKKTRRFDDAIRSARKAIDLARATGQQNQVQQLNSELKLYEAGLPYHRENK